VRAENVVDSRSIPAAIYKPEFTCDSLFIVKNGASVELDVEDKIATWHKSEYTVTITYALIHSPVREQNTLNYSSDFLMKGTIYQMLSTTEQNP